MSRPTHRVIALGLVILVMGLVAACRESLPRGQWFFGESLAINLQDLQRVPEVRYTHEDKEWVIRPSRDGYEIAALNLSVRNRSSSVAILSIGKESLRISDDKFVDYDAIDPFTQREQTPVSSTPTGGRSPILDKHVPFIWGPVDLPQECMNASAGKMEGCELKGWVMFEVPKGVGFSQVVWETSDIVYVHFNK